MCGTPYAGPNFCPACGIELTGHPAPIEPPPEIRLGPGFGVARAERASLAALAGRMRMPAGVAPRAADPGHGKRRFWHAGRGDRRLSMPTLAYLWYVLSLDRYEKEPLRAVAFAFGWGAVGAVIFSVFAELFFAGFAILAAGEDDADTLTLVVGAPVIEEAFKGLALLLLLWFYRQEFDNVLDGVVYGAVVGLGFAMTENIGYFIIAYEEDGASGLGELFLVRAVINGFGHAMYTGIVGAAIGWSRSRYARGAARIAVPVLGYLIAVLLHMLWNGGVLFIADLQERKQTIWSVMLVEVPLFVIPP